MIPRMPRVRMSRSMSIDQISMIDWSSGHCQPGMNVLVLVAIGGCPREIPVHCPADIKVKVSPMERTGNKKQGECNE